MTDRFELAIPAFRSAIDIMRELARNLEPRLPFDKGVVGTIDTVADQCETLIDHLEAA